MATAIVTDSTAYLTKAELEQYTIHMVPLTVVIDGETYEEEVTLTADDFYDKIRGGKNYRLQANHQSVSLFNYLKN